ncbi:MAG: DNRLRE domain-containing protein [Planctomycetes bacterium]|nr:DNRLRE domain-containing protein [Planctomycetota bacterium]
MRRRSICRNRFSILSFAIAGGLVLCGATDAQTTLVPPGSVWKYDDTGTDLGTGWREILCDDTGWPAGPAELGYGDGDEATVLSSSPVNPCYYFRLSFEAPDPAAFASLTLRLICDDGAVVYLNGVEILRTNLPEGEIAYSTWASSAVGDPEESTWSAFDALDVGPLGAGTNILAVEVHQSGSTSTDVSLDLELIGQPPVPAVTLLSPADGGVATATSVTFTASATDATGLSSATLYMGPAPRVVTRSGPALTEDAQISADSPTTNYGSAASANVDGASPHAHAVIKFPSLIGTGPGQVPLYTAIASATLEINCTNTSPTALETHRLTEDWTESEVTWNERSSGIPWGDAGADGPPSWDATPYSADLTATGWRTIDLTAIVQAWCDGEENCGIVIVDTGTDGADFDSSESGNPPVLTVRWGGESFAAGPTIDLSGLGAGGTFAFDAVPVEDGEEYLWNCLVTNSAGGSAWAPADFRVSVDTHLPAPPALVGPADGASGVLLPPTLSVAIGDPDGDALDVTFFGRSTAAGEVFTIIALPDTQYYCRDNPQIFEVQTSWIANSAAALNIVFVSHEGDLVQTYSDTTEWIRADAAMSILDNVVPYGLGVGNHDQPTENYNLIFPYTRYEDELWYGGHYGDANDDSFQIFSAGGMDFIAVHLQFWPSAAEIDWANGILAAYPDRKAIITTHGYIDPDGNRNVSVMGSTQYVWDDLVVPNPNVFFVLCGHEPGEYTRTDAAGTREVHQLLADYQSLTNGGNGYLRILTFVPALDTVYVQTYSPYLDAYMTDADSEFALDFPMQGFRAIGTAAGIPSGETASIDWSDLVEGTEYEWYAVATDPSGRSAASAVWSFTSGGDETPPAISGVEVVDVTDTSARIIWTTNEPADSLVDYGLDADYGTQARDGTRVTEHSVLLSDLSPETTYHFRVTSSDAAGNGASTGDSTFDTLAPNRAPVAAGDAYETNEDVPLAVGKDDGVLANDDDPDGQAIVAVLVTGTSHGTLNLYDDGAFSYAPDPNAFGSDSFTYKASDGIASSDPATVTIAVNPVNDPPVAPAGLSATAGDATVTLDWGDGADPDGTVVGYNVYRRTTPGDYGTPVPATEPPYVDNGLENGVTYYYAVTSIDNSGDESDFGDEVSATPAAPSYDAYVVADPVVTFGSIVGSYTETVEGDGSVQAITEAPNGSAGAVSLLAEYTLHTGADPSGVTGLVLHLTATWTGLDGSNDDLIVEIWDGAAWQDITTDLLDGTFEAPSGAAAGCVDAAGDILVRFRDTRAFRKEKKDTLAIDLLYAQVQAGPPAPPDTTPPDAPAGLTAAAAGVTVSLGWFDNGEDDLAGYEVYRVEGGGSYEKINASLVTESAYQDTTGAPLTTYSYVVTAVDRSGNESDPSDAAIVTTEDAPPAVHVEDIAMDLIPAGKNWKAQAIVLIYDETSTAVSGASVVGDWFYNGDSLAAGTTVNTGADGTATIESPPVKAASGATFTFVVADVQVAGRAYDPGANIETQDSISVP